MGYKKTGVTMQINLDDDYSQKAQELDEFFMKAFYKNKWGLNKNIKKEAICSYDQYGEENSKKTLSLKRKCSRISRLSLQNGICSLLSKR